MPGASAPTQVVADDEAALADAGRRNTSKAPTPSGSTALARQLAHRSLSDMMIPPFLKYPTTTRLRALNLPRNPRLRLSDEPDPGR